MISRIKGKLVKKNENKLLVEVQGIFYEINIPRTVYNKLDRDVGEEVELVIYYYLHTEKNRSLPVMIGFLDEMEREFFEIFISVSGIGPRAALRAFDKPVSLIARAIEDENVSFLKSLAGIGTQKAKRIIAHLQGKVGRFALIKTDEKQEKEKTEHKEIIEEAKQILKRLQYNSREIERMIKKALTVNPDIDTVEVLLNEIYRQRD